MLALKSLAPAVSVFFLHSPVSAAVLYTTSFGGSEYTLPSGWNAVTGGERTSSGERGWHIDNAGAYRYHYSVATGETGVNGVSTYTGPISGGGDVTNLNDYALTTTFRKDTGSNITGLVGHYQDIDNFYHVRLSGTDKLELYRKDGGSFSLLQRVFVDAPNLYESGEAWTLQASFESNNISANLYNDLDVLVASFDYTDNSASAFTSGGIGLRAGHPSVYTSFSLEAIPEPGSLALLAGSGLLALRRRRAAS